MAKFTRNQVGSFLKAKPISTEEAAAGKIQSPPYIKFNKDVTFKKGDVVRVENQKYQIESLEKLRGTGKLDEEFITKQIERANNIPAFVIADLIVLNSN